MDQLRRCDWVSLGDPMMMEYHDKEWGVPVHDDQKIFEFLVLEGFQAGLSWATILRKRKSFRSGFNDFDPRRVARYDDEKIQLLKNDASIVRNEAKIRAMVGNAKAFLEIQREFGSFNSYVWKFVGGSPKINKRRIMRDIPAKTPESDAMSFDLIKRGFRFTGSTICYAHIQATGMVNDHLMTCFRYKELTR